MTMSYCEMNSGWDSARRDRSEGRTAVLLRAHSVPGYGVSASKGIGGSRFVDPS
jgi:hypothetical protein